MTITIMPPAKRRSGDPELAELFGRFEGHLVTPAGAAALLGLSRKTVYALCARGDLRAFRSERPSALQETPEPHWVYIPLVDVRRHAKRTGRATAEIERWGAWLTET